ncbi:DUF1963 domain-containing protein [Streptomyces sp. B1866]|uniref:DUF1963 domain-containing protein n=1 Tax=Streptomyces sp. B1866 TaxID=3075431 RepID=UPI0028919E52|nr:DUF1963 domain-containing protein [Streptomyces sp. B1866]MDT3396537.1 DUF1963 domain-containing protein [Streptomyces sp. B1866]
MTRTTPPRPVDVEVLFPEVAPYRREVTRLHPRQGEPGVRDSSVGGPLLWPAGDPWPYCDDSHPAIGFAAPPPGKVPLVPVAQLYAADVPALPWPPGADLLQLLWCPYEHEPHLSPRPELRWRASAPIRAALDAFDAFEGRGGPGGPHPLLTDPPYPAGAPDDHLPAPCELHPEQVVEYPRWDLPEELDGVLRQRFDLLEEETGWSYWYQLSVAPGIKAGGYPNWTQDPDWPDCEGCGRRMDHLLTVDSAEFDAESAGTWLPVEDWPPTGRITDVPYERRRAIQSAHDLMIGDLGGVYVFVCPRCPQWPYAYRADCS